MSIILTDASDAQLASAVQENLHDLFRAMTRLPKSEMVERAEGSYHLTFPMNPMFKGAWGTRLTTENADAMIEETRRWFQARNAPFAFWWVTSQSEPADLGARLPRHGFQRFDEGDPGMAVELFRLDETIQTPPGLEIVKAETQQQVQDWGDTFVRAFEVPPWAGQAWVDATLRLGVENAPWTMYVGYLDGRAVATNMLFCGGGVASVYGVGTIADARGKGIGAQITLQPFLEARTQGYQYGVLFSTLMGHPVYKRLGFRDVGFKVGRYLWRNE